MIAYPLGHMLRCDDKTPIEVFSRLTIDQPTNQYGANTSNASSANATKGKGYNFLYTADDKWLPRFDLLFQHYLGNFFRYLNSSLMNISMLKDPI